MLRTMTLAALCLLAIPISESFGAEPDKSAAVGVSADADNTKVNKRDTAKHEVTADQQSNSKADVEVTRAIRQAIVKDSSLSTYAHNIKIITVGGKVTLKGPVKSVEEKSKAESLATACAGVTKVENQLSVKR